MLTDVLVPGNRWDLLAPYPLASPTISVVVTHYCQPAQLARTWAALCRQTLPPHEVVIADDGSTTPPRPPTGGPPVSVVTQPDLGFRAARARNHGAQHSSGEILVFLDADMVPEPGFLRALTRHIARCPDVLAVGRRRHADLTDLRPGQDPAGAPRLNEPEWLRRGYADSRDLLDANGRSFRFVISAVLACRRSLFNDLHGFDERFVGYGGEDWDLAYRAWNSGAVLVHEPEAVAWHDGEDWAGRASADGEAKDSESARLASLIPEPTTRGAPLPAVIPDVLVDVPAAARPADTVRTVHSLLRQTHRDLAIRLDGPTDPMLSQLYGPTLRIRPWTDDQLRRARAHARVCYPLPPSAITHAVATIIDRDLAVVELRDDKHLLARLTSTRAVGRARRWRPRLPEHAVYASLGQLGLQLPPTPPREPALENFFRAVAADPGM